MVDRPWFSIAFLGVLLTGAGAGASTEAGPRPKWEDRIFSQPHDRVAVQVVDTGAIEAGLSVEDRAAAAPVVAAFERFRDGEGGGRWVLLLDRLTGRPALMEGQGVPWIPGTANSLTGEALGLAASLRGEEVPLEAVDTLARKFLQAHPGLFAIPAGDLVLNRAASGPVLDYLYFVEYLWTWHGIPVEGAGVSFRLNHGNLVQMGQQRFNDAIAALDPMPAMGARDAWSMLDRYLDGIHPQSEVVEPGRLLVQPFADPAVAAGALSPVGRGLHYRLVWEVAFREPGDTATWTGRVDAHTGEVLSFMDRNAYGHAKGAALTLYATDGEVSRPFPYLDIGGSPMVYTNSRGAFSGTIAASAMNGQYIRVQDACGGISVSTTNGALDFGTDPSTDCGDGDGNTRAARTQYHILNAVKSKALTYYPSNAWLLGKLTTNTNVTGGICPNAWWDGSTINFCRSSSQRRNYGESPGITLHEWGHGFDANDGNGLPDLGSAESHADTVAVLSLLDSCSSRGMRHQNCSGYGNPCTDCTGSREHDWAKRSAPKPFIPEDMESDTCGGCTPWACAPNAGYKGPCGKEGHCEGEIAVQALWDLGARKLTAAPYNLDPATAWQVVDRLFFASRSASQSAYSCPTITTTHGCDAASWFSTFRVVDDCDGNLANGTPHAAAVFAAFNDHKIACTGVNNTDQAGCCPALTKPTLTAIPASTGIQLEWTSGGGSATRYFVYRNDTGCDRGFTRIATVQATQQSYIDEGVAVGVTYFYRVQAATNSAACASAMSACVVKAMLCPELPAPTASAQQEGNHARILWTESGAGTTSYTVHRSRTGWNQWQTLAETGAAVFSYDDYAVEPNLSYTYRVAAWNNDLGCQSGMGSGDDLTLTCPALIAPVLTAAAGNHRVDLSWTSGGPNAAAYRIARSLIPTDGFVTVAEVSASHSAWTDHSVENGSTRYYQVAAVGAWNLCLSDYSSVAGATPQCPPVSTPLLNLYAGDQKVFLSWTSGGSAVEKYKIHRGESSCTGPWNKVIEVPPGTLEYVDRSVVNGTPYFYKVEAVVPYCGKSSPCESVIPHCVPPDAPVLSGTPGYYSASLSWSSGGMHADAYLIYRGTGGCSGSFSLLDRVQAPATTYLDADLTGLTFYYYKMVAVSTTDACASSASNCVTVYVQDCASDLRAFPSPFACDATVQIRLREPNWPYTCPINCPTVYLSSTTDPTEQAFGLQPCGYKIYCGSFQATTGAPGAGQVRVSHGDTVTLRYQDANSCGSPQTVAIAAEVDCLPPIIHSVQVLNLQSDSATINWQTNEPADTLMVFGTGIPPNNASGNAEDFVLDHNAVAYGLSPCTPYYFKVASRDRAGSETVDTNGGSYYTFTTPSQNGQRHDRDHGAEPLAIPDNDPAGVASAVTFTEHRVITDAYVNLGVVTHPYVGDLSITLESPAGTTVALVTRRGGSGQNFENCTLWDSASIPIGGVTAGDAPFTGSYRPEEPFSTIHGADAFGEWKLRIADGKGGDAGALVRWGLWFAFEDGCSAYLDATEIRLLDDACYQTGSGGGNGFPDPGEDVTLSFTLDNRGNDAVSGPLAATLSAAGPGVVVTDAAGLFPAIGTGSSGNNDADPFTIRLDPELACGEEVQMDLAFDAPPHHQAVRVRAGNLVPEYEVTVLSEDFGGGSLPAGWTVETAAGGTWGVTGTNACSPSYALTNSTHISRATDAWVFTAGVSLAPGKTYALTFAQRVGFYLESHNLSVWLGTSPTGTMMKQQVWSATGLNNAGCLTRSVTFTVLKSGTYYLGFHCTSPSGLGVLTVDDIALQFTVPASCTAHPCVVPPLPGEVAPGDTFATALRWTGPETLVWPAEARSDSFRLYRGVPEDLPKTLAGMESNACLQYEGTETTASVPATPPAGSFYWFVVTGVNGSGEGPAGPGTAGSRRVLSWGNCPVSGK